jgi:excisionase family DNA binding protein
MKALSKKEAADYLGISIRTLQRYMTANKISYKMQRSKFGDEATFDEAELDRFKKENLADVVRPAIVSPLAEGRVSEALARRGSPSDSQGLIPLPPQIVMLLERIIARMEPPSKHSPVLPISELAHKLVLKKAEAAALAGVPEGRLKLAIDAGALKASKDTLGRGWRIKRSDLDAWIAGL